jgi:glycosyltransferase AglE
MSARQPFVSVIIPVFNDAEALALTLTALQQQTYPATRFEVIVVDNASTDDTVAVIGHFPAVQLLYEHQYLGSPYSCRNRGLEVAQGEIIAFLDATCEPVPRWLEAAVAAFAQTGADLVGGRVKFKFAGKRPSIGEFYDSVTNMKMKQTILRRKRAITANLFVRRAVVVGIGPFPEGIRSGGDLRWTRRATRAGYKLVYCELAVVHKPARPLFLLLKKQWRVGKGKPAIWAEERVPFSLKETFLRLFIPPKPTSSKALLERASDPEKSPPLPLFWLTHYAVRVVSHAAYLWGWLRLKIRAGKQDQQP